MKTAWRCAAVIQMFLGLCILGMGISMHHMQPIIVGAATAAMALTLLR